MDTEAKFMDMLEHFDTAMLVTHNASGGLDGRPMAIAELDSDGGLWFVASNDSGKMVDIAKDSDVAVTLQASKKFLTLSGKAAIVNKRDKISELWKKEWQAWFPKGKDDPAIRLIHVVPSRGEYWDNSGFQGLKYRFEAGKAYLQGEKASTGEDIHADVSLGTNITG